MTHEFAPIHAEKESNLLSEMTGQKNSVMRMQTLSIKDRARVNHSEMLHRSAIEIFLFITLIHLIA